MRCIGLDVHQSFCVVAICEAGKVRLAGRIETSREQLELFAGSLGPQDRVVLEATGTAFAIARILRSHVAQVVVANAAEVRAISHARVKSDAFDARTLARLLWADMLESVWVPDERTGALRRRVARRASLVRQRTRAKNEIHGALARCLLGKPPVSDLFGVKGRAWLSGLTFGEEEQETVEGCLAQIAFCDRQIEAIDKKLAQAAIDSPQARRLMTIPGIGVASAVTLMASIGQIERFSQPRKLVGYLGLDPKVRQSGDGPARTGSISKRGNAQARSVLVEAAWAAMRAPGPLRAFGQRVQARSGSQVAAVAVARKTTVLAWHLLTRGEDYAFQRPSLVRGKLRAAELAAGAPRRATRHDGPRVSATPAEKATEQELVTQAEHAYKRITKDWTASRPAGKQADAGATPGRASSKPSKRQAARQAQAPRPAL